MASTDKTTSLLSDAKSALQNLSAVENVHAFNVGFGTHESAFRTLWQEGAGTEIQGWAITRSESFPSDVQEICQKVAVQVISVDGYYSYDSDDSTREDTFNDLLDDVYAELAKASSWPSMLHFEPGRDPELEGPEVVRAGPNRPRLLHAQLRVFPAILMVTL